MKITKITTALSFIAAFGFLINGFAGSKSESSFCLACVWFCISALNYDRMEKSKE